MNKLPSFSSVLEKVINILCRNKVLKQGIRCLEDIISEVGPEKPKMLDMTKILSKMAGDII